MTDVYQPEMVKAHTQTEDKCKLITGVCEGGLCGYVVNRACWFGTRPRRTDDGEMSVMVFLWPM